MRGMLLSLVLFVGLAATASAHRTSPAASARPVVSQTAPVYAIQVPDKKIDITVGERGGSVVWYRNPVWVAIGVIAVVLLLLIIVLAMRTGGGGGTTIIRD